MTAGGKADGHVVAGLDKVRRAGGDLICHGEDLVAAVPAERFYAHFRAFDEFLGNRHGAGEVRLDRGQRMQHSGTVRHLVDLAAARLGRGFDNQRPAACVAQRHDGIWVGVHHEGDGRQFGTHHMLAHPALVAREHHRLQRIRAKPRRSPITASLTMPSSWKDTAALKGLCARRKAASSGTSGASIPWVISWSM